MEYQHLMKWAVAFGIIALGFVFLANWLIDKALKDPKKQKS